MRPSNNRFCSLLTAFAQKLQVQNMFYDTSMLCNHSFCAKAASREQKLLFEVRMLASFANLLSDFSLRHEKASSITLAAFATMLAAFVTLFTAFA